MARYFLTLSYDGAGFNGWQIQRNTGRTVQQVMEEKISMVLRENVKLTGCGRTDTGVNARNYVAHMDCSEPLELRKEHWMYKMNTVLPGEIAVNDIRRVKDGAHARFQAVQRAYHYYVITRKDPFRQRFAWFVHSPPDVQRMNEAAALMRGRRDFACFSKSNTQVKTTVCNVSAAKWVQSGQAEWRFSITADRFLRGMVRGVVGTLMEVGRGRMSLDGFLHVLESGDRKEAGENAPPNALFFSGVEYPKEIFI